MTDERGHPTEGKVNHPVPGTAMAHSASRCEMHLFPGSMIAPECALSFLSYSAPVQNWDTKADRGEAPSLKERESDAPLWMLLVLLFCGLIGTFVRYATKKLGTGERTYDIFVERLCSEFVFAGPYPRCETSSRQR